MAPKVPAAFAGVSSWQDHEATAIGALARGEADEQQQRDAFAWIVNVACATYGQPFVPDDQRSTDFLCGRMFVGQQIVKLAKLNVAAINRAKEAQRK